MMGSDATRRGHTPSHTRRDPGAEVGPQNLDLSRVPQADPFIYGRRLNNAGPRHVSGGGGGSAPVGRTCSHPTALLQGFHHITQERHVRVTQFVRLSSPLICSPRCAAGGPPHRGGAIVTYGERSGFIPSGLPTTQFPTGRRRLLGRPINTSTAAAVAGTAVAEARLY